MESSSVPTRPRFARDAIWHSNLKIISVGLSISIQEIHGWGLEDADWLYLIVHCPNITSELKKKERESITIQQPSLETLMEGFEKMRELELTALTEY